jgi:glycosyltransferase involved in cell wall biosynthesis
MRILHVGYGFQPFHHGGLIAYSEDLMDAQVERGHDVSYFFCGRHYPLLAPRVRRWRRRGRTMYELLSSPVAVGTADRGTREPEHELEDATVERLFRDVLAEARPDVVHVQELAGLPSSLLAIPSERGVPVTMTLHDYLTVCPVVKLFDVEQDVCRRIDPAPVCVQCCRDAPLGNGEAVRLTLRYHREQLARRVPVVGRVPGPGKLRRRSGAEEAAPAPAEALRVEPFRRRRAANVERLNRVDLLLAVSPRVQAMYEGLGVHGIETLGLTLSHLRSLTPKRIQAPGKPIRFVTLNGCASAAKGAHVVTGALDRLEQRGLTRHDLTIGVAGHVDLGAKDRLLASPLVHLIGDYMPETLDSLLDRYDVGIVPSLWEETFGFVGLEMLAKGLPLIGNERGGVAEYTRDGETGWLNRSCDSVGLAGLVAGIVARPAQVTQLNRAIVAQRDRLIPSMPDHAAALDEIYAQISSTARPAG